MARAILNHWSGPVWRFNVSDEFNQRLEIAARLLSDPEKTAPGEEVNCVKRLSEFVTMARSLQWKLPPELDSSASTAGTDWKVRAREIADQVASERVGRGIQQISAHEVCGKVAEMLAKEGYRGQRGPRDANTVRSQALKGWQFAPGGGLGGSSGSASNSSQQKNKKC